MVVLNKIYTRTGDDGGTALGDGQRRKKFDARIEAYGAIDETNSSIGLARTHMTGANADFARIDAMLARIQNDLFDVGADLCVPETATPPAHAPLRILGSQVDRLEREIDELNGDLSPLRSFVLPGGGAASAALHMARTVCRRAERRIVQLADQDGEIVGKPVIAYVNRLSDFLFVAARYANDRGASDVLWRPGATRGEPAGETPKRERKS
jgi:cob(I)alamin adenosyltransferase